MCCGGEKHITANYFLLFCGGTIGEKFASVAIRGGWRRQATDPLSPAANMKGQINNTFIDPGAVERVRKKENTGKVLSELGDV